MSLSTISRKKYFHPKIQFLLSLTEIKSSFVFFLRLLFTMSVGNVLSIASESANGSGKSEIQQD